MKLTEEEAAALQATINDVSASIGAIVQDNFGTEIAKLQDVAKALKVYTEISAICCC